MKKRPYLAVDELQVTRALRVAVSSSELGTSLVVGELGHATVSLHLGEVEGTVQATRKLGNIDVKSELLVEELEDLVAGVGIHEINPRAHVGRAISAAGHEFQAQRVARIGNAVGALIVCAIKSTVCGTGFAIGTKGSIPAVTTARLSA